MRENEVLSAALAAGRKRRKNAAEMLRHSDTES